jgi:hypothetical protein
MLNLSHWINVKLPSYFSKWLEDVHPSTTFVNYVKNIISISLSDVWLVNHIFSFVLEISNGNSGALESVLDSLPPVNAEILKLVLEHLNRYVLYINRCIGLKPAYNHKACRICRLDILHWLYTSVHVIVLSISIWHPKCSVITAGRLGI